MRRRRQEQSSVSRHIQTARKQQLRKNDRGGGKAHMHDLHERRKAGGPDAKKCVFRRFGRDSGSVRAGESKSAGAYQEAFPDRHRGVSVGEAQDARVLLDFLDRYVDRLDFELIQMDTDSNYMAISGDKLEDIIRPELRAEFEATKEQWLAWDKWSGRTPGLFKLESEGSGMIALCSKCYFVKGEKNKFSTKGMLKKKNEITWQRFKAALNGSIDRAENRGFRMVGNHMMTYEQHKLGLSAYYDKRWVLPDGIHKEPIEFHMGGN